MIQRISNFETFATVDQQFSAINLSGYVAVLYASYILNGEVVTVNSDVFSLFFSKELIIPKDATDVHLYALASNGSGQWIPIYNNNFLTSQSVALKLYGTIFSPQAAILSDPNPTALNITATNNAAFITRYTLTYTFNNLVYTMKSQSFTSGISRKISIPQSATNVSVMAEFFSGISWAVLYDKAIPNNRSLNLVFTGIVTNPGYQETIINPPSGGTGNSQNQALIIAGKKPHKNVAELNDIITFAINISNSSSIPANNVVLKETVPNELDFIANSLKINGVTFEGIDLSSSTLNLGDIQMYSSLLVTYQVKIIALPSSNKFMNAPVLMFSYVDSNNSVQNLTSTGSVTPLSTGDTPTNPCCCCCCCCCPCSCQSV